MTCYLADDFRWYFTAQYVLKSRKEEELVPWRAAPMHAELLKTCDIASPAKIQVVLCQ